MNVWSLARQLFMFVWRSSMAVVGWLLGLALRVTALVGDRSIMVAKGLPHLGKDIRCPRGHTQSGDGFWECGCGARFSGWVWMSCPACGARTGHTSCNTCGHVIVNPHLH